MAESKGESRRMTAEKRREIALDAATAEFAVSGFDGTSGEAIAERTGISQPYLFRLFGTKRELFLAVVERMFDRIDAALRKAAEESASAEALPALAAAYIGVLEADRGFLVLLQSFAACGDDEIRFTVRRRFAACYRYVEESSGAEEAQVRAMFANGMLVMAAAGLRLPELASRETWARRLLAG